MRWGLFLISFTSFINPFMISSINIALPSIENELQITSITTTWILTSYILANAVIMIPAGRLAQIYSKKKIFIYGVIIFCLTSFFIGILRNISLIIFLRFIQGIGAGMFMSIGPAILSSIFPKEKQGRAFGINVACVYIGLSSGPFIGGMITQYYGWRIIFLITALLSLLIFILSYKKLNVTEKRITSIIKPYHILLYIIPITLFIYSSSCINTIRGILLMFLSLIFFYFFIEINNNSQNPLIETKIIKSNRVFLFSTLAALINYTSTSIISFFLNIYLQTIKLTNPQQAGKILIIQPLIMAIISPFAGKISEKKEPRIISSIGMGLSSLSLFMSIFISKNTDISYIYIILIVAGIGFGLFSSPNTNAVMSSISEVHYPLGSSILATSRVIGQAISLAISTLIISWYISGLKLTSQPDLFLKAMKLSFFVFLITSIPGIIFSLKRGKLHSV